MSKLIVWTFFHVSCPESSVPYGVPPSMFMWSDQLSYPTKGACSVVTSPFTRKTILKWIIPPMELFILIASLWYSRVIRIVESVKFIMYSHVWAPVGSCTKTVWICERYDFEISQLPIKGPSPGPLRKWKFKSKNAPTSKLSRAVEHIIKSLIFSIAHDGSSSFLYNKEEQMVNFEKKMKN